MTGDVTADLAQTLDPLDRLAASAFDGYIVRKDLALRFKGQYPVPMYVGVFLLGRYCASTDDVEIGEGLAIVEQQMRERTVRPGEEELFKSRARERGAVKLIDVITARLDAATDSYVAELPSLRLKDVRIEAELVAANERMLTGGFYAEIQLEYDAVIAQERNGRPFAIDSLRPIQLSQRSSIDEMARGRRAFSDDEWRRFLLRSVGFEPEQLTVRAQDVLLRMVPFVQRNYNLVELGPRGTGKSHLFQQVSPYAHLVSGGKATVARMFVNNSTGQRGLVCQYDVVCFDEISGVSFDQKDGVNIMKGYMESGEFSRGRESIRAGGSIVLIGNFEVDVVHQQRIGHLLGPLPPEMRNDTAFMDRIHAYLPGWDVRLALECRRRIKEQQKRIGSAEFRNTHFSYQLGFGGVEQFVATPEVQSEDAIGPDPLPPGQVWAIGPGGQDEGVGLYRIDVNENPGSGVRITNVPVLGPFRESVRYGEQNLLARARELVGDIDPHRHEFTVQLRAFDAARSGSYLGLPVLLAFCGAALQKSLKGGLVAVGGLNLGGGIDPVHNAVSIAECAIEKGATTLLIPISARRELNDLSNDMATTISILFYADPREALLKALVD